jgi:hypothetical protein
MWSMPRTFNCFSSPSSQLSFVGAELLVGVDQRWLVADLGLGDGGEEDRVVAAVNEAVDSAAEPRRGAGKLGEPIA